MVLGGIRGAEVGDQIKAPLDTGTWGEGKKATHPRTMGPATAELALKAVGNEGGTILAEGGPVVMGLEDMVQLFAANVRVGDMRLF